MHHLIFQEADHYPVALLIKPAYLRRYEMQRHYLDRLAPDISASQVIAFDLDYGGKKKPTARIAKAYLEDLLPILQEQGVVYLYCADAEYFKVLTRQPKAEPHVGYVLPCALKGFEHMRVVLGVNYGQLVYNPEVVDRLDMTLETLVGAVTGSYQAPGTGIIRHAHYPNTSLEISAALDNLHQHDELACDIEAFSLHPFKAGIGTIAFAWSQHEGIAFACDYSGTLNDEEHEVGLRGVQVANPAVRHHLRRFFETYQGRLRWHNASYDIRSIIAVLWMRHPKDYAGLLTGLSVMTRTFHDTKVIAYLATNSTAGNKLGLKALAHEFTGNYAQEDIKDIRRIPLSQLLEYNLVDSLATNYVFDKHYPAMVRDQQKELYETLMLPSLKTIVQMELVGMPMEPTSVTHARRQLEQELATHQAVLDASPAVYRFNRWLQHDAMEKANAKLKAKQHPLSAFSHITLNPNSGPQLQAFLFEHLELPVLDYTDTKQPATGRKTLEKLKNHTTDAGVLAVLDALIGINKVAKILSAFIPKFEEALVKDDRLAWLHGSFNLGGTVSGRLSSSDP